MSATSQNGYPVLFTNRTTGSLPRLRKWQVPGAGRYFYLRDGSCGFVLTYIAQWWDKIIHAIDVGTWDDWGWAVRPIRGQTSGYSNHASGTAADIDATLHPRGVPRDRNLTSQQIAAIHALMSSLSGAVRWGGDYSSTVDAMHFEINTPIEGVERVALRLAHTAEGIAILEANPGAWAVISSGTSEEGKPQPGTEPKPDPVPVPHLAADFTVGHCSGLWDAPEAAWSRAIAAMRDADATVISLTETGRKGLVKSVTPKGWVAAHLDEKPGQDECSILWATRAWESAGEAWATQVAETQFYTGNGVLRPPVQTLAKPLRHKKTGQVVLFSVTHDPSDIEGKDGFSGTPPRIKAHQEATEGRHEVFAKGLELYPSAARIDVGDRNVNYKLAWVREWWSAEYPMLTPCWEGNLPDRGTLGNRVIDWVAASPQLARVEARVLGSVAGLDHNPLVVKYAVRA